MYVLTAAHCTKDRAAGDIELLVGQHNYTGKEDAARRLRVGPGTSVKSNYY